jgi:hypothetical protein
MCSNKSNATPLLRQRVNHSREMWIESCAVDEAASPARTIEATSDGGTPPGILGA